MKLPQKILFGQWVGLGLLGLSFGLAQDDQDIDKVSGRAEHEFQQMIEQDALGDISTLRQFIADSLRLLYDERFQQEFDSLESVYTTKIETLQTERDRLAEINQTLKESLAKQPAQKPLPESGVRGYDPQLEARFFEYEKMLKMDTPRRKTSFLKIASAVEDIAPFQIEELNFYYEKYFPDARTDSVLDFIIQLNIRENDWVSAERNILKFLYLFPESPLYEEIKTVRSLIFQNEKYFKPYSNILGELVSNAPLLPRPDVRYFRYVEVLKDLPDLSVRNAFIPEARRFLALYPDSKYAPDASLWIAKSLLNNNQPHSAFLFYQKIMILYPESAYYIGALHASGVIQQEQFTEFTNAVATFSDLIKRFPNDSLAENAQFRIAKIYDENLNNWEQASQEYQIFANRHPQSPQAVPALMRKAALQAEKMNMIEEAVRTYKSIDERYPNTPDAQEALAAAAQLYFDKTRYEQAVEVFMSIFQKYPQSEKATAALEKVADIYQNKLKDNQKAIEILNMIITNYPDTKASAKATKTLQKLEKVK